MKEDPTLKELDASLWAEKLKSEGEYAILGDLRNQVHNVVGVDIKGREDGYQVYPVHIGSNFDMQKWHHLFTHLSLAAEQEAYRIRGRSRESNYIQFTSEFKDMNKWYHESNRRMAIEYASYVSRDSYPSDDVRAGLRLVWQILVPESTGRMYIQAVLSNPDLIEDTFNICCQGLTNTVKRYQTNKLEVIEGGRVLPFGFGRILGKERKRMVSFSKIVGEVKEPPV